MLVLGVSAFYRDSVAAAQEERFTRRKHEPGFPANAIA
jgi:carbamoyltransferase